ncbi:ComEC/Rec2 family competence protein [Clostridium sp. HBUAS56017]|uniref:ComEC/Rec2 family competence protein n=1 Tax=Clostridium sp. HBUAS56017 TaxID=2571128 RepID=UPI001FA94953|nr:ComEC/Rec2 family competence protein [Clostridium sp. HBUAS56017]
MYNLFLMIFLISFICLIVGLIKPSNIIRWGNQELKTKKNVLKYFGIPLMASFILCGLTAPKNNTNTQSQADIKSEDTSTSATETTLGEMKIHYIDVGQGDSELIQVDGKNILIDAGTNDKKALNYLKSIGIDKLDYVIATHPHEDHIGSMDDIIKTFNIGTFYSPKVTTTTKTYENMIDALKAKNLKLNVPKVNDTLNVGNATLTFLAPNGEKYKDINNTSIVVKLKYGNTSYLFMGDAEDVSESEILAKQLDIQSDVLKVGHHGSESSSTQAFLDKVNPKYAIISCGKNNEYGHPHQVTLDKLNAKNINIFRTDLQSTIICTSDGKDIKFNTNPVDKSVNVAGTKKQEQPAVNNNPASSNDSKSNENTNNNNNNNFNNFSNDSTTTNEPAQGNRTVYWTPNGKSYHYSKNCPTLKRSKKILEGPASSCPKKDPCNDCVK